MSGITDLQTLIGSMEPVLKPGEYVFTTFNDIDWRQIADLQPISVFKENEGISLVVDRKTADENKIPYDSVFRLISLHIHSSLDAVGHIMHDFISRQGIHSNAYWRNSIVYHLLYFHEFFEGRHVYKYHVSRYYNDM